MAEAGLGVSRARPLAEETLRPGIRQGGYDLTKTTDQIDCHLVPIHQSDA